jgi:hypothetical protein
MFDSRAVCLSMAARFLAEGLETRFGSSGSAGEGEEILSKESVCKVEGESKGKEEGIGFSSTEEEEMGGVQEGIPTGADKELESGETAISEVGETESIGEMGS